MQNDVVLGISKGANPDKIKQACRTIEKKHHPDVNTKAGGRIFILRPDGD